MSKRVVWVIVFLLVIPAFALSTLLLPGAPSPGQVRSTVIFWGIDDPSINTSTDLWALLPAQPPVAAEVSLGGDVKAGETPQYLFASASSSGSNYYWAGAESFAASALSNSGIQGDIQVVSTSVVGCLSFWVADEMSSNAVWGQVGYYICNGATPIAFYQIWKSGAVAVTGTTSVTTGSHLFSMYQQTGTTWAYALDGAVFGTYDMGSTVSSSSYPIEALSEEGYVSSSWNPPRVGFAQIQVMEGGAWSPVATGYEPYGCSSSAYSCWGVQGNLQDSAIPPDSLIVGGSSAAILSGATLWSGSTSTTTSSTSTSSSLSTSTGQSTSSSTVASTSSTTSTSTAVSSTTSSSTSSTVTTTSVSSTSSASSTSTGSSSSTSSQLSDALLATLTIAPTSTTTKSTISFAVVVTDQHGNPMGGATVSITITKPNGRPSTVTATTNSAGQTYFQYRVSTSAQLGTYAVVVTVNQLGYASVSLSGSFAVT